MKRTGALSLHSKRILSVSLQILLLTLTLTAFSVSSTSAVSLEETISRRRSTHGSGTYNITQITEQELLKVLWAAYGTTSTGHRSVPSIGGNYSLIIYVVNATGSYRYIPENHSIVMHDENVTKETIKMNDQGWPSEASAVLVIVWNKTKMDNQYFASAEAGCLVQNVYLEANALDLGTCCVGGVNSAGLRNNLTLPLDLTPLLVMPLGYPKSSYPPASPNYSVMNGNLPPVQYSNMSLDDAIRNWVSVNQWSSENLSSQELSQLLWAAYGSANTTHRTTPSAVDIYPLIIYVSNSTGVYRYIPEIEKKTPKEYFHYTEKILEGDKRYNIANACSGQMWAANAHTILLIAYNSSFNNGSTGDGGAVSHEFIEVDAGCVIQNLFLEATAWNLGTAVIGDGLEKWNGAGAAELRAILNLSSAIVPLYVMPVGHLHDKIRVEDVVVRKVSEAGQVSETDPWTEYYANASVTTAETFNDLLNITWVFNCTGTEEDEGDNARSHYTFRWTPGEGFTEPTLTGHLISADCVNASLSASSGWFRLAFRFGKSADPTTWTCKVTAYLNATNFGFKKSSPWTMNTYISFTFYPSSVYWTGDPGNLNISANSMPLNITVSSNVNVAIRVRGGGNLMSNGNTIPLSNVYIGQSSSPSNNDGITLTTSYQDWKTEIPPSEGTDHSSYWFLTIPEGTPAGTYTFTFYIEVSRL